METPESQIIRAHESPLPSALSHSDQTKLEAALREGWRLTPATLGHKITNGRWIPARHLLYISLILATEIAKGNARIIMTMPARHGKSELISVNTPIWFLERWSDKFVMSISYGSELATDFSLRVRDTFQNEDLHHLLRTRIRVDKKRVDRWLTPDGGGLTAAGIGGPLTGRGADLMVIDDYIKNAEDSLSETLRRKTWEWFKSTAYTRLEPNGSLVILATRWNIHDLIDSCITELPHENWKVINFPALAEINDPLGREVGEALWPERYSRETLLRIKETLGAYWWAAMYQQQPKASMAGMDLGNAIKIIPRAELPDETQLKTIRAWDLAATEGGGDWTTGALVARQRNTGKIYIKDMRRFQKAPGATKNAVFASASGDGHGVKVWMEQEPGSSGKIVIKDYKDLLAGYAFEGEKATGPIEVRASPFLAACEAGSVYMVADDWNQVVVDEVNAFGAECEHDDQIVSLALGYNKLVHGMHGSVVWGRDLPDNVVPIRRKDAYDTSKRRSTLTW